MYEQLFRSVLFPIYEGSIKGRYTHRYLYEYEKSQWLNRAALEALQLRKLNALLAHCWSNVPFLAQYWTEAGLRPGPLAGANDLARFPILTKELVTRNFEAMRAKGLNGIIFSKSTSGSTGEPFRFEYTQESYARRTAVMWRGYRWCGSDLGRRTAYLWGSGAPLPGLRGMKDRWYHAAFNRLILNCFELSEANIGEFVAQLNRFRPRVIVGFIAPLALISRYVIERGEKVHQPEAIIGAAEALTKPTRELVSRAFNAPVYNSYGCREFMLIACECRESSGLHVNMDHLVVETVDSTGSPVVGTSGEVCVTDLHNYAMPLVRYLNGDCATYGDRRCGCGRELPLFESVDGRVLDIIVSPDGRTVPGEFFVYVMLGFPQVRQYQVIQDVRDSLEIRIVPREDMTQMDRERLVSTVGDRMGGAVRVWLNEVEHISLTSSGKRRVTVSNLKHDHAMHVVR